MWVSVDTWLGGAKKQQKFPLMSAFLPDSLLFEPSTVVGLRPPFWGSQIIQRSPGMKLSEGLLRSPGLCDLGKGSPGGNAVTGFSHLGGWRAERVKQVLGGLREKTTANE